MAVKYIDGPELSEKLKAKAGRLVVLDVRNDEEYSVGRIKGAVHKSSSELASEAEVDELIATELKDKDAVVVHCALSQVRGPACAKRLKARLDAAGGQAPEVLVLRGGFLQFSEVFGEDAALVEGKL